MEDILVNIQHELKAPKNQRNSFGGYNYRSSEDILEAVKPILFKYGVAIIIEDEIVAVGNRIYVKATAKLKNGQDIIGQAIAYAREPETKKGMDEAQITGATSSYARKYALNGLFAIDDTKDADTMDNRNLPEKKPVQQIEKPNYFEEYKKNILDANSLEKVDALANDARKCCKEQAWTKEQIAELGNVINNKKKELSGEIG